MTENRTFRLFHKKKKNPKNPEKGHREPIVVRMFKDFNEETVSAVTLENGETAEEKTSSKERGQEENENKWDGVERRHRKFERNQKYFTIMVYGLMFVFFGVIIISCILKITSILDFFAGVLKVLAPFLIGAMLAFIMNPIVSFVERGLFQGLFRMKKPKLRFALSVILSYVLVLGLVVFGLTKLGPQLADSIKDLVQQSSQIYDKIIGYARSLGESFPAVDFSAIVDRVAETLPTIADRFIAPDAGGLLPTIFNTSVAIVRGVINVLLGIALSIYMVCDKRRIARAATSVVYAIAPYQKAKAFINVSRECFQIFGGFIIGKALDSLIIGIITFIVVSILRLPYTVLVSVIVGVTNLIPFFGPLIGAIPGLIIYLCIDPWYALIFGIAILAIQQFDGWILGPMILGDSTGIRPIWVIFGITFFGAYFGVIGMFLGVPITAVIIFLIEKVLNKRLKKKHIEIT